MKCLGFYGLSVIVYLLTSYKHTTLLFGINPNSMIRRKPIKNKGGAGRWV